ncbi:MAG TPA: hypothetical protein VHG92_00875 [Afifellaceae bacterium]|nr:hypothetical protein [Afifellaceae bacterium]
MPDLHRPMEPDRPEMEPRDVEAFVIEPADGIPNNPRLPLLVYRAVLLPELTNAAACQSLFKRNSWGGNWVDGIYDYWHFHVTGHEALGCVAGSARVAFGGDAAGLLADVVAGDVVVIPAGVGHKLLEASPDFTVVGGYPPGQSGAITCPGDIDLEEAEERIAALDLPETDPVHGRAGLLTERWQGQCS